MHQSVLEWSLREITYEYIHDKDVIETGALNVNGSVWPLLIPHQPRSYTGTDMVDGPGVDRVCKAEDLPPGLADVIICLEMLEHARHWRGAMTGMANCLRMNGHLFLTTRGPGFPYHPHPLDYWRFSVSRMREIFTAIGMDIIECMEDPQEPGVFAIGKKVTTVNEKALDEIGVDLAPVGSYGCRDFQLPE